MTAKIKLNAASGGGSISIQAPSSSSNNRVISLPDIADGTLLTSQSSLDSTKLSPAISGGKFSSYAVINHSVAYNQGAGTFTNGAWRTRELNTEVTDVDGIVSISSNQFTLQAGTYLIKAQSPAYRVDQHVIRLYNVTDSSVVQYGMSVHASDGNSGNVISPVVARVTIGSAKAFSIKSRVSNTDGENSGLANNFGNTQIYSIVKIFKEN